MYVEFRSKGFWAYDVVAAVLLKHMIDAANQAKCQPDAEWLASVIAQWQVEEIQSWKLLDDERIFTRGQDPIPTAPVIRLGNAIISLLQNRLEDAPAGTWWFFWLGEKKETIDMVS
jgi:hypothetical protein